MATKKHSIVKLAVVLVNTTRVMPVLFVHTVLLCFEQVQYVECLKEHRICGNGGKDTGLFDYHILKISISLS
jgi:hypothetical protein